MSRPLAGPVEMPHGPWPAAIHRPSTPGARPSSGRPSRLSGRAHTRRGTEPWRVPISGTKRRPRSTSDGTIAGRIGLVVEERRAERARPGRRHEAERRGPAPALSRPGLDVDLGLLEHVDRRRGERRRPRRRPTAAGSGATGRSGRRRRASTARRRRPRPARRPVRPSTLDAGDTAPASIHGRAPDPDRIVDAEAPAPERRRRGSRRPAPPDSRCRAGRRRLRARSTARAPGPRPGPGTSAELRVLDGEGRGQPSRGSRRGVTASSPAGAAGKRNAPPVAASRSR